MEGVDREWNLLSPNTNRISYNNLDYENYTLRISKLNINGKPSEDAYTLEIRISHPGITHFGLKLFIPFYWQD